MVDGQTVMTSASTSSARVRMMLVVSLLAFLGVFVGDAFAAHPVMVTWVNDSSESFVYNNKVAFKGHTTHKSYYGTHASGFISAGCRVDDSDPSTPTGKHHTFGYEISNPTTGLPVMTFKWMEEYGFKVGTTKSLSYPRQAMNIHIERVPDIWVQPPHHTEHEWYVHFVVGVHPKEYC